MVIRKLSSTALNRSTPILYGKGLGLFGALGTGSKLQDQTLFTPVEWKTEDEYPVKVGAGWAHSAILTNKGNLYLTGRPYDFNNLFRLHRVYKFSSSLAIALNRFIYTVYMFGEKVDNLPSPHKIDSLSNIADISVSAALTMILDQEGQVFAFGSNTFAQTGERGPPEKALPPIRVYQPHHIVELPLISKIDSGLQNGIALSKIGGKVFTWGKSDKGQSGVGETKQAYLPPLQVTFPRPGNSYISSSRTSSAASSLAVTEISSGFGHHAVITEDGAVYVWGKSMSLITDKKLIDILVAQAQWIPRRIDLPGRRKAVRVQSSLFHIVIQANDDSLWVMGKGEKDKHSIVVPIEIVNGSEFICVSSNSHSSNSGKGSNNKKIQQCITTMKKGHARVTLLTSEAFRVSTNSVYAKDYPHSYTSFDVLVQHGQAMLVPLDLLELYEKEALSGVKGGGGDESSKERSAGIEIVDYSRGWLHEMLIVR